MILHGYWRSTSSWRVRIALGLKGLAYEYRAVNLVKGEQYGVGPQGRVPLLEVDGRALFQSVAILEWLEETAPSPALLPTDPWARVRVRAAVGVIACDVQPLGNLGVLNALKALDVDEPARTRWAADWIERGFYALEQMDDLWTGAPTMADVCLAPQVGNAVRFGVALDRFPRLLARDAELAEHPAFAAARPERQPDAPAP